MRQLYLNKSVKKTTTATTNTLIHTLGCNLYILTKKIKLNLMKKESNNEQEKPKHCVVNNKRRNLTSKQEDELLVAKTKN